MDISRFNLITEAECPRLYIQQKKMLNEFEKTKNNIYWIRIAILLTLPPVCDYSECIKILKELSKQYFDITVYIIGAYIMNEWFADEENYFIDALNGFLTKITDSDMLAIIYFLIGKSYENRDSINIAKEHYKKSIDVSPSLVNSYISLSKFVSLSEKVRLLEIAKKNVTRVIKEDEFYKITLEELCNEKMFIQEYIMGVNITECVFDVIFKTEQSGDGSRQSGDGSMIEPEKW